MITQRNLFLFIVLIVGFLTRKLPHSPNFTAIGAMSFFLGVHIRQLKYAIILFSLCLYIGDLIAYGFHLISVFIYLGFGLAVIMGHYYKSFIINTTSTSLKDLIFNKSIPILYGALLTSLIFFFVCNFGVWWITSDYVHNFNGLKTCYLMGLPYLKNQVFADLLYSILFFGIYEFSILKLNAKQLNKNSILN